MIIDGTHVEFFNNQLYVHICTFKYRGESVYYFSNLYNQLLCTNNGKFEVITDPYKKSLYRNVFGLVNPLGKHIVADAKSESTLREKIQHIKKVINLARNGQNRFKQKREMLDEAEQNKYKEELKEAFREMKAKFDLDIDLDQSDRVVDNLKYFIMRDNPYCKAGAIEDNLIGLTSVARNDSLESKKIRIHEGIHTKTGKRIYRYIYAIGNRLLEAETENLAIDYLGDKVPAVRFFQDKERRKRSQAFNFPPYTSYKEGVCLLKQMEVALGKKSYNSIINGDMSFERDFIKQYGLITFIKIVASIDLMKNLDRPESLDDTKLVETLNKTQNYLLKRVFEKDFAKVQNPLDAQALLKKLRAFDLVRARSYKENDNHQLEEDPTYSNYYIEMLGRTREKLASLGFLETQVDRYLDDLDYQKQRFNSFERTPDEEKDAAVAHCAFMIRKGVQLNPDNCFFEVVVTPDGLQDLLIINNGKLLEEKRITDSQNRTIGFTVEEVDYQSAIENFKAQGFAVRRANIDPKEVISQARANVEESIKREAEQRENGQNETKQGDTNNIRQEEQKLVPYKKQNILQQMFNKMRDAFKLRKKKDIEPPKMTATSKTKKEEGLTAWDLRRWGMKNADINRQSKAQAQERMEEPQRTSRSSDSEQEL